MISKEEISKISMKTGLNNYQQEKEYFLKLFLFYYFENFEDAVFKGGTCMKFIYNLDRFSEDLDFNITNPELFQKQVGKTLEKIKKIGFKAEFKKEELFNEAYACTIAFEGPLFSGNQTSKNSIRIDAGKRLGTNLEPEWNILESEYPETKKNFLVKTMTLEEILAEKIIALHSRQKGRDLFDTWFLLKKRIKINNKLIEKKAKKIGIKITKKIVSEKDYLRDIKNLTKKYPSYKEAIKKINENQIL